MAETNQSCTLLVVGADSMLAYLLKRYAEQCGLRILERGAEPKAAEVQQIKPAGVVFASVEHLRTAQSLVEDLSMLEIPVLVCASVGDELRARELGADGCLFHPLTYENFWMTVSAICLCGLN